MNAQADSRSIARAIGLSIAVCGTLDITDALVFYWFRSHTPPMRLLQGIAAAPFGPGMFKGGLPTACLGLLIHFCVATFWVSLFILLAQRIVWMFRNAVVAGLLYGLVVFFCMNYLVLPIMHRPLPSHFDIGFVNGVLALVLFIGFPVGLINRGFAPVPVTLR